MPSEVAESETSSETSSIFDDEDLGQWFVLGDDLAEDVPRGPTIPLRG